MRHLLIVGRVWGMAALMLVIGGGFMVGCSKSEPASDPEVGVSPEIEVEPTPVIEVAPEVPKAEKMPEPPAAETPIAKAKRLSIEGKYAESLELFESIRTGNPNDIGSLEGFNMAILYTLLEDPAGHKAFSTWMLDHFADTQDQYDAEHTAKAHMIYPGPKDEVLMAKSAVLSARGAELAHGGGVSWMYMSHGMVMYRQQNYEEAETWLNKTIENTDSLKILASAHAYSALNNFGQGNKPLALVSLAKAGDAMANMPEDDWVAYMGAKIALKEATMTIAPKLK